MKGGTSQNLSSFYFHNSWIYVEIMTKKGKLSHMNCAVLCLPEYSKNVQGHTYCKQSSTAESVLELVSMFRLACSLGIVRRLWCYHNCKRNTYWYLTMQFLKSYRMKYYFKCFPFFYSCRLKWNAKRFWASLILRTRWREPRRRRPNRLARNTP